MVDETREKHQLFLPSNCNANSKFHLIVTGWAKERLLDGIDLENEENSE